MKNAIALLAAGLLVGCVTTSPTAPPEKQGVTAARFYPLIVGTTWTYEVNLLGEKRSIDVRLLREINGAVEDSTGAQLSADAFGVRDQKRYLLRNPIEPGTRWTNVVSVSSVEHYEILAVDQPCETPAGSWKGCVIVQSQNRVEETKVLVNEMTFAPDVGLVQIATLLDNNGTRIPQSTLRLAKYAIPGAGSSTPAAAQKPTR